ncbi:MAG: restriction endonuclease [Fimbriimonadaceae bacterium]|nr:restriction endonuclease [Fimbriimonadaceae bacterium]
MTDSRVPYSQQFSPEQTPIRKLLAILRQNQGNRAELKKAIAAAFFKAKTTPEKIAANTVIALGAYGIIDKKTARPTDFGDELLRLRTEGDVLSALARRILLSLDGMALVETLRDMRASGEAVTLQTLPRALEQRGLLVSRNSSDLSAVLGWLRSAGVLRDYEVDEARYVQILGTDAKSLKALQTLTRPQFFFVKAMLALGIKTFTPYSEICDHAEGLYSGQVRFNRKDPMRTLLRGLVDAGLIEIKKQPKSSSGARGGKADLVRPTAKIEVMSEEFLTSLGKESERAQLRVIAARPWADVVADVERNSNPDTRGRALEVLAIKICQTLDLKLMQLRMTDDAVTAGGEVDALMESDRLIYSRWQVQCKASPKIALEAVAKEVGLAQVTLANVILIASTGVPTPHAKQYRDRIIKSSNLNIILLEGHHLKKIAKNPTDIVEILNAQASEALRLKPSSGDIGPGDGGGAGTPPLPSESEGGAAPPKPTPRAFSPAYTTTRGSLYQGDALEVLPYLIDRGTRAKLIMTSPPFALLRKKAYGNEDADQYIEWFQNFVPYFKQILEPGGSLVIDIGGSWLRGLPVRSTYHFELLIKLCRDGFFLAQDFYHYNPARLPTPAEWVTIRRLRVKDAVNAVWWLVKDPFVDADNRKVLRPYSDSMLDLIQNGYSARLRPSGHDISTKFGRDNGGSIPPNLLELSNTESNSHYLAQCRKHNLASHPARFPRGLPEFFIKFLTKPGDVVLDPFAGSNVTGEAAEVNDRRWIGIEINDQYVRASHFRFDKEAVGLPLFEATTSPGSGEPPSDPLVAH